jgi:hypothetical protein
LTIRYNGKEEEVKVLKDMPTSVVVKGQNGAVVEIKKVDLDVLKVHNETKGERKFGKVMGEFEEGALKTPQGKTVTDPAQAKAIAYSEADKVENTWEWNVKQSDVIDYINGNPTATDIQRICVKHLGTYDTTGVEAYLVDKNSNKWAVVKKGTKPTVKSVNNLKRARKAMNKKTGNSDDLDIALKKNKEEFNKSREREKEFRKKASEYFNSGDKRNSDFYVKMAESETKMQDEITKRIIDIEKKINK